MYKAPPVGAERENLFFQRQLEYMRDALLQDALHWQLHDAEAKMRIKTVRYKMLRKTAQYENDTAEAEVEVVGDTDAAVAKAIEAAKATCRKALGIPEPAKPQEKSQEDRCRERARKHFLELRVECGQYNLYQYCPRTWASCGAVAAKSFARLSELQAYLDGRDGK